MRNVLMNLVCTALLAGMLIGVSLVLIVLDVARNSTPVIGSIMFALCLVSVYFADKQYKILRNALTN